MVGQRSGSGALAGGSKRGGPCVGPRTSKGPRARNRQGRAKERGHGTAWTNNAQTVRDDSRRIVLALLAGRPKSHVLVDKLGGGLTGSDNRSNPVGWHMDLNGAQA